LVKIEIDLLLIYIPKKKTTGFLVIIQKGDLNYAIIYFSLRYFSAIFPNC